MREVLYFASHRYGLNFPVVKFAHKYKYTTHQLHKCVYCIYILISTLYRVSECITERVSNSMDGIVIELCL
jgi:hypothetical protein